MKKFIVLFLLIYSAFVGKAQVCGIPGNDGPANLTGPVTVNTYYPPSGDIVVIPGSSSLSLGAVPATDISTPAHPNSFGNKPIVVGDLLLIIQMQDASMLAVDNSSYGSGSATSGPDNLGGTGYTNLNNTGLFEYVVATNSVPLTGGNLTFRGAGAGNGTVNTFINNASATAVSGKKTFQIIRIPQYSSVKLLSSISAPRFNGVVGGVIAFDVAGVFDFNGYTIDASEKGFRGGIGVLGKSDLNNTGIYMDRSGKTETNGKGEGIVGTPRYTWDGFFEFGLNTTVVFPEGLPGGPLGKGAPGNAGGGANDHNAGGGGGGNGGYGGVGGDGVNDKAGTLTDISKFTPFPNGGRPGSVTYNVIPDNRRLIMGGGGGGGDNNESVNNSKGGVGGGIVIINAGKLSGPGAIKSNGGKGLVGLLGTTPDGAGGGGAGGSVYIKVASPNPTSNIAIEVKGGDGGNTERDAPGDNPTNDQAEHGPGGGGGGGLVFHNQASGLNINVDKGLAGKTMSGLGTNHGAANGTNGRSVPYTIASLPAYLQGGSSACLPELETSLNVENPGVSKFPGSEIIYTIKVANAGGSAAAGVLVETLLDNGIVFQSATVANSASSAAPADIQNTGTLTKLAFGDFIITAGNTLTIVVKAQVNCTNPTPATYHASAQALYSDPTRSVTTTPKITAANAAFPGASTSYEGGIAVPGFNFDGSVFNTDDVAVMASSPISGNLISIVDNELCLVPSLGASPQKITGLPPSGVGNFIYQWESSVDGVNFVPIAGANLQECQPPPITITTHYRRLVSDACSSAPLASNIIVVYVKESSDANFELPIHCVGDATATFDNTSVFDNTTTVTYLWDFGDPASGALNTSTAKNGQHLYTNAGVYNVKLTTTSSSGCESTITKLFTVSGPPVADFTVTNATELCNVNDVEFANSSNIAIGNITKIEWFFDNDANSTTPDIVENSPATRTAPYIHAYPALPVTKTYKVRMMVYSGIKCTDEITQAVIVNATPEITFGTIPPFCIGDPASPITQVSVTPGIAGTGVFSGMGVNANGVFTPFLAGAGTHRITYTFTSTAGGCTATAFQDITVSEGPTAETDSLDIMLGASATMPTIAANSGLTYKWTPSTNLSSSTILNPVASPEETTIYELTVTDILTGCTATGNVKVIVNKIPKIPNTFTPNGDGINDYWRISNLETYSDCTVKVYSRYGEQLFDSNGYKQPWDGTYQGKEMPTATYYYVIDPKKGRKPITGSITIIR